MLQLKLPIQVIPQIWTFILSVIQQGKLNEEMKKKELKNVYLMLYLNVESLKTEKHNGALENL